MEKLSKILTLRERIFQLLFQKKQFIGKINRNNNNRFSFFNVKNKIKILYNEFIGMNMEKIEYLNNYYDLNSNILVEVFDELPFWSAPFGLRLLEKVVYHRGIKVLDIGCGTGFPLIEIAMRLGNTCKIYGLDPWDAALTRAKKKIEVYNIKNIELISGFAENIPLETNSIDLIISNNGLNNVADIELSLKECSRVIKRGGQFLQTMNLDGTMLEFYSIMRNVLEEMGLEESIQLMQKHIHKKRMPINDYITLLRNNNFSIESVTYEQFDYRFSDGTSMLNHFFIRLAFLESWKSIVPEKKQSEVFQIIENRINEQSQRNSHFKLSVPFVVIDCRKQLI